MPRKKTNPNRDRDIIDKIDLSNENNFTKFLKSFKLEPFRHVPSLNINSVSYTHLEVYKRQLENLHQDFL